MASADHAFVEKGIRPLADPSDWVPANHGEEAYSANQVIAAFKAGFLKAGEQAEAIIERQTELNIEWSGAHTRMVIDELRGRGLTPLSARLKLTEWNYLEVLVVLEEGDTAKEEFLTVLEFVGDLKEANAGNWYSIDFHFCEKRAELDETVIDADRYWRRHSALEPAA